MRLISTRWLAHPNRGGNHFPHDIWSSSWYLVQHQSEGSCAKNMVIQICSVLLIIELRMIFTL